MQTCLVLSDPVRELRAERESRAMAAAWVRQGQGGDRGNRAHEGLPDACITTKRTCRDTRAMSLQDIYERILSSLHEAMLDDAYWPVASALMDEACGSKGNILVSGDACAAPHCAIFLARWFYRGQRHEEYETEYFNAYHHRDERGPRLRDLPDSKIVSVDELYTDHEKRISLAYNEMLMRSDTQNGLHARLDGPDDSWIVWTAADPVDDVGWSSRRVEMVSRILPHVRQFVRVRLALVNARALGTTMADLLDNTGCGIIQLDPQGRIVATNGRALELLRKGDGLTDDEGGLRARLPQEDATLQSLLARALPRFGGGVSGSMMVTRSVGSPPRLVLHVSPVGAGRPDLRASRVGAIVLIVKPETRTIADPELVAGALGLTPAETRVAMMLAEGCTLLDIAVATGRSKGTVRWHLKQIFAKNRISRQVELVQLVRSLSIVAGGRH